MKQTLFNLLLIALCSTIISACLTAESSPKNNADPIPQEFKDYWFQGVAELTSFELEQPRYGEMRKGLAVMVFVKEDFSKKRLVKLDEPEKAGKDRVPVLKFNLTKTFNTGIYTYTVMQSVFKPIQSSAFPNTLRITSSNQEWCGQFFTRFELKGNKYKIEQNSYFDGEEDEEFTLPLALLEDEIWEQIRIDPSQLPQGNIEIVPCILTQELTHQPFTIEKAKAELTSLDDSLMSYTINYSDISRKLKIDFEAKFPYRITAWEETFKTIEGWDMEPKLMTTKARRIKHTLSDYWNKKYNKDEYLRKDSLGIDFGF